MIALPKQHRLLIMVGMLCLTGAAKGQRAWPLKVALGNEATAIPFTLLPVETIHPTVQVGTEFRYKTGAHAYRYQTLNVGYMYHQYLFQGVYINSEFGYDYLLSQHLSFKSHIGLGYLHTFVTGTEYQLQDGVYELGSDKGNARMMPSLSLGLGYRMRKEDAQSPELFLLYKSWVEYPYSPGFIPVMTHVNLEIGIKFNVNKGSDEV